MIVAEGKERVISLDEEQDIEREAAHDVDYELRDLRIEFKDQKSREPARNTHSRQDSSY